MTETGRAATPVLFNEIDTQNWFPGGTPLDGGASVWKTLGASRDDDQSLGSAKCCSIVDHRRPPADGGRDARQGRRIPSAGCILERGGFGAVHRPAAKAARRARERGRRAALELRRRDDLTILQGRERQHG
jgi:hypothetical protein